jgi:tight adherence protein B
MGAILGLGLGLGLVLILLGLTTPAAVRAPRASRLSRLIDRAGVTRATPSSVTAACVGVGLVAGFLALVITAVPIIALIAGVAIGWLPIMILRRRANRRSRELRSSWPDAVDTLGSAVKAGMSLPEAVADLAERGPVALRPAFAAFTREYRASGSFSTALFTLSDQLRDPVADRVIASLRIAREVGGTDLGRVLATLSGFLRVDARTRGEIEARQSWTVNAARVAVAAPWVTLLLLCTRPEAVAAYSTPAGALIIIGAAGLSALAYRLMIGIGRLPEDPRVVRAGSTAVTPVAPVATPSQAARLSA